MCDQQTVYALAKSDCETIKKSKEFRQLHECRYDSAYSVPIFGPETAEETYAPAPANPHFPQSEEPNVSWDKKAGMWRGRIWDTVERTTNGGWKYVPTAYFADEADCVVATRALRKQIDEKYADFVAWKVEEKYEKLETLAAADPKSDEPGVNWDKAKGKWVGAINDPLERTASGGQEYVYTACFADEAACVVATRALREQMDEKYWATLEPLAAADPLTKGLPRGPKDASEAELDVVYWRPHIGLHDHKPYRAVRSGLKRVRWMPAPVPAPKYAPAPAPPEPVNPQSDEPGAYCSTIGDYSHAYALAKSARETIEKSKEFRRLYDRLYETAPTPTPTPPEPANPQSDEFGVSWNKKAGKWQGQIYDTLERTASGGPKYVYTAYFADEAACVVATRALREQIDEKYWATLEPLAAADPLTKGLPRGPKDASEAEVGVVYWRPIKNKPYRFVRSGLKKVRWTPACQHDGCAVGATQTVKGSAKEFCGAHGGRCQHGHTWFRCRECNPNATNVVACCSSCAALIANHRHERNGGTGYCVGCDAHFAAEEAALAAARAPVPTSLPDAVPAPADAAKTAKKAKKASSVPKEELKMLERLVLGGYIESFDRGIAPRPGEFTRQVYVNHRCKLDEFKVGERKSAYVDFVVCPKKGGVLAFLEVDENEHKGTNYPLLCDTTRMVNVVGSLARGDSGNINVLWLRVNPDTRYKIGDTTHTHTNVQRADAVVALLDALEGAPDDPPMRVAYCFYQMHADCTPKLLADPEYAPRVLPMVHRIAHRVTADGVELEFRSSSKIFWIS